MVRIQGVFQWDGLGKCQKCRLSFRQRPVKGIRHFFGAFFGTLPASDALFLIDVSGKHLDTGREPAGLPLEVEQTAVCHDLDIGISRRLNQFRRKHAGGAVVGWKGFIQLRHGAAQCMGFLQQIHIKTGVRKIQGGLDSADSATNDYGFANGGENRGCHLDFLSYRLIIG